MKTESDNGTLQRENAPRYVVSVGSFVSEGSAINRRNAVTKAGYRSESIDLQDDSTTTTVTALLLIAEQIKRLTEKVDTITETVNGLKVAQTETAPKAEPPKPKTVVELINRKREEKGVSIRDLSEKSNVKKSTLGHYIADSEAKIPTKSLISICGALGISTEEIIKYL